jgi:hypothetical protein
MVIFIIKVYSCVRNKHGRTWEIIEYHITVTLVCYGDPTSETRYKVPLNKLFM